jgi:hypothetical protein
MSYFDTYKSRVKSDGNTPSDSFSNATKHLINESFMDSPTYSKIDIGGIDYDVRITDEEKIDEKKLLFRPDTSVEVGLYANISGNKWLILNFDSDRITPKSIIKKADRIIKWKDSNGILHQEPCVLESVFYEENRDGDYFYTPKGNIRIYTQYNESTKKILDQMRFVFGNNVYLVGTIDNFSYVYDDKGYIILYLEKTAKLPKDDFNLGIADNYEVYANNTDNSTGGGNGGGDWLS